MATECPNCNSKDSLEYILVGYVHYDVEDVDYNEEGEIENFEVDLAKFNTSTTAKKDKRWAVVCKTCKKVLKEAENFIHPKREYVRR